MFIKRITCPDGSSFTLYLNCVPDSCNISEAREPLDTFLSNLDSGCNGEVNVLYGVIDGPGGGSSQPSVAPAVSPTSGKGGKKENVMTVIAGALVVLNLLFA